MIHYHINILNREKIMTKAKVQTDDGYEEVDTNSQKEVQRSRSLPYQTISEESAKLMTDGFGSGLDVMNSMTHLVAEHLERLTESTQDTVGTQFRLVRDSLGNYERLTQVWIQKSMTAFANSLDQTRSIGDKSTETMKTFVRVVKSTKN
jgi:hypothetical protein